MSRGSGKVRGYYVEARIIPSTRLWAFGGPPQVGRVTWVTESWTRVDFEHSHPEIGVKNELHSRLAEGEGILTHVAAKALMAWLGSHHMSLEFRLVKVEMKYKFSIEELGVGEPERFGMWVERDLEFSARETPEASPTEDHTSGNHE